MVKWFDRFGVFVRYFSVSVFVYFFVLIAMYMLVEVFGVGKITSYVLIYLLGYVADYSMTLTLVFRSDHHWLKVIKFIVNTVTFLALGTLLFNAMISSGVNYLIATIAVAITLLPLRFAANKYFVYR